MRRNSTTTRRTILAAAVASSLAVLAFVGSGCVGVYDHYTIVMTPRGDSLERSIRVQRAHQSAADSLRGVLYPFFEPEVEARLVSAYSVLPDTARTAAYSAVELFPDVPDDVGTRGHYRHWATPLGDGYDYAERIRGMEDPEAWIVRRFGAADTLAQATAAWLRFELLTQPEWPRVSGELEPELRRIARTTAAVTLLGHEADSLSEGWLSALAHEHPLWALMAVPLLGDSESVEPLAAELVRARADLASRLGLHSEADEARVLGFLADGRAAATSYWKWALRSPQECPIDGPRIFSALAEGPGPGDDLDLVQVRLHTPRQPFSTNGKWDDATGYIRWGALCARFSSSDQSLPLACSARWSVPDTALQQRLFGYVVLEDERLYLYASCFALLSPARQAEWNRMLLALRPGRFGTLERFRFANERGAADASACMRRALLDALAKQARWRAAGATGTGSGASRSR